MTLFFINTAYKSTKIFSRKVGKVEERKRKINSFFTSFSQLTVIVSGSQGIFFTSESHFQTLQQNASGYESIEHQLKMHVNTLETDSERRKNISGNGSLFILFVKVKKDAKKKAFAKAPLF